MSTAYYHIPATAACADKLRDHFTKQKQAHQALVSALTEWKAGDVRIAGEGANTALSKCPATPGWKYVKSRGWWRPDTKTDAGKQVMQRLKSLPIVGKDMQDLSEEVLGHKLLCWGTGRGLAIHYANIIESKSTEKPGYLIVCEARMKSQCDTWPPESVELTATQFEQMSGSVT